MKDNKTEATQLLTEEGPAETAMVKEPKFRRPKRIFQKKKRRTILVIIALLILAVVLTVVGFKIFEPETVYDDSAAFYFSSNLLSEDGGEFPVYDSIEFDVYNYADALRVSKEPLESFDVKVEADGEDITSKSEIATGETAMQPDIRSGCSVVVEVPEEYYDKKITVSVTSSPIKKTLKADFTIKPEWGYELKDAEGLVCADLVIFANKDVTLKLEWDSEKLTADSTDSYIKTAQNGENSCIIELVGGNGISIPMFKDPSEDFSGDKKAVKVTKTEKLPDEKEPEEDEASETEEVAQ